MIHSNRLKILLLLLQFNIAFIVYAQTKISSPYSRYGIGDLHSIKYNDYMGMGGISIGMQSSQLININNPASYGSLDSTSFLAGVGLYNKITQLVTANEKRLENYSTLNYLTFAFPATKWMGFSFGLIPYSNTGYSIVNTDTYPSVGRVNYLYNAYGGINQVYLGTGLKFFNKINIGINGNYLFGGLNKTRTVVFPDSAFKFSLRVKDDIIPSGFMFNFGIQYKENLTKDIKLVIGGIYAANADIRATNYHLSETYIGSTYLPSAVKDTIFDNKINGNFIIPESFGGGFSVVKDKKWLIGADYKMQNWSNYEYFGSKDSTVKNSYQFALGGQFQPDFATNTNYFNKITYRLGFRYNQSYLELKNTRLDEYGITFGFGLPLKKSKTTINLGFELGKRGTTKNNLIRENFCNITINFAIYERWFIKYKYD